MADIVKSVLLVDYDSIFASLEAVDPVAAGRLGERVASWIEAIEAGRLVSGGSGEKTRRRILIRRCYADPQRLGANRGNFTRNGFEVIDCPPLEGRERTSADIQMALDTVDAVEHPTGYEEFILLAADSDLTPVLRRVRAHNRLTVIYATPTTASSYKAVADGMIEEAPLVAVLTAREVAPVKKAAASDKPAEAAISREAIEAVAHKVSGATNVPLLPPRTFAELFKVLAEEISANGYHFQDTAENVAGKLTEAGRNVTRRQVVFVVKGLALKGHVFSTSDTPVRLAEVFREQVLYLVGNAGLNLDDREKVAVSAWIVDRASPTAGAVEEIGAPQEKPAPAESKPEPSADAKRRPSATKAPAAKEASARPAKSPAPAVAASKPGGEADKSRPAAVTARPATPAKPASPVEAAARSLSSSARPAASQRPLAKPLRTSFVAGAKPSLVGSRPAATGQRALTSSKSTGTAPARPGAGPSAATPARHENDKNAIENSILAAIAEAVDVLVEDGGQPSQAVEEEHLNGEVLDAEPIEAEEAEAEVEFDQPDNEPPPDPPASEGGESDDIGDEIQRIIASYSRNRGQSRHG